MTVTPVVSVEILVRVNGGDPISLGTGQIDGPTMMQIKHDIRDLFHKVAAAVEKEVMHELDRDQPL